MAFCLDTDGDLPFGEEDLRELMQLELQLELPSQVQHEGRVLRVFRTMEEGKTASHGPQHALFRQVFIKQRLTDADVPATQLQHLVGLPTQTGGTRIGSVVMDLLLQAVDRLELAESPLFADGMASSTVRSWWRSPSLGQADVLGGAFTPQALVKMVGVAKASQHVDVLVKAMVHGLTQPSEHSLAFSRALLAVRPSLTGSLSVEFHTKLAAEWSALAPPALSLGELLRQRRYVLARRRSGPGRADNAYWRHRGERTRPSFTDAVWQAFHCAGQDGNDEVLREAVRQLVQVCMGTDNQFPHGVPSFMGHFVEQFSTKDRCVWYRCARRRLCALTVGCDVAAE